MKKSIAFTLAETLIVIGIIGIISALTLPNLNNSTSNAEKLAKVKKIYQNLEEAYNRATAVYGPIDEWFVNVSDDKIKIKRLFERFTEFMKIAKKINSHEFILSDGTYINIGNAYLSVIPDSAYRNNKLIAPVWIDINGNNKGNNREGEEVFIFEITNQGIYPEGQDEGDLQEQCFGLGYCTKWVIEVGNMDYLKVNSDGKCPNGTTLSWTNTSCK